MALDAFAAARRANGPRDARHIIAHLELIDPADLSRFRSLAVVADIQPFWAYVDEYMTRLTWPKLGPERSRWIYPFRSLAARGGPLCAGSDWNVSSMNPLDAIQVALTRRDPEHQDAQVLLPEERVDLPSILAAYTIGGAFAAFEERETGSIELGKAADLIVLSRNLFEAPTESLREVKVLWTLLEGAEVFRDQSFEIRPGYLERSSSAK
jgi:predicted amidohydrolase YtcJ